MDQIFEIRLEMSRKKLTFRSQASDKQGVFFWGGGGVKRFRKFGLPPGGFKRITQLGVRPAVR